MLNIKTRMRHLGLHDVVEVVHHSQIVRGVVEAMSVCRGPGAFANLHLVSVADGKEFVYSGHPDDEVNRVVVK